jgi:hypothetical protein
MKQSSIITLITLLLVACNAPTTSRVAEFQSVRFSYDPALFTEVKAQTAPEAIMGNENWSKPQHILFTLTSYVAQPTPRLQRPKIAVYSVADFEKINTYFSQDALPELRNLLTQRPSIMQSPLKLPPDLSGCCFAYMQVAYIKFQNGSGVRFVSYQRGQSVMPLANVNLYYVFHGLTNDGKYYLSALLPLNVSFLPERPYSEIATIPTPAPNGANLEARINATIVFNEQVIQKIAKLAPANFTPGLKLLDGMIQSLQVR